MTEVHTEYSPAVLDEEDASTGVKSKKFFGMFTISTALIIVGMAIVFATFVV